MNHDDDSDLHDLKAALGMAWGLEDAHVLRLDVLERRVETRLRFNAMTPVIYWCVKAALRSREGADYSGEIELFQWLSDASWEVIELRE